MLADIADNRRFLRQLSQEPARAEAKYRGSLHCVAAVKAVRRSGRDDVRLAWFGAKRGFPSGMTSEKPYKRSIFDTAEAVSLTKTGVYPQRGKPHP